MNNLEQNRWNYLNKYAYFCPYRFLLQGYKKALDVNNLWRLSKEDKAITNVKAFYECWKHSGKEMRCVDQYVFYSILCRSAKNLHTCIQKGYLDICPYDINLHYTNGFVLVISDILQIECAIYN